MVRAVDGVTVAFAQHQLTAVVGPSGSGKSTLMHCAAGLDRVTSGRVLLADGTDLTALDDDGLTRLRRDHIGFVFQAFNLLPHLTAEANILLPDELAGRTTDRAWFDAVVEMLGIRDRLGHHPTELSGGQQQRVAIARALLTRSAVIFADEPTGALDQEAGRAVLAFLRRCADELGQTIVMVTHDPAATAWAHRVVELTDGRITGDRAVA